ncbi:MFS general substrate transporter [Vararia minispora EC-137]|uniref:MFS general substrate transporter n=1 Tax=Vararia minispora EC-137 TaxID=1314806 RepID=A0ACB8QMG6_9AGAM|nr:MFS general substrate transporter [Vararia minispora EC-137]
MSDSLTSRNAAASTTGTDALAVEPQPGLTSSTNSSDAPYLHNISSRVSVVKPVPHGKVDDDVELQELPATSIENQSDRDAAAALPPPDPFVTHKALANAQYAALCWSLFMAGWNDGTTGPLLPRIREVYHVGFAVVSLIFIVNCIGFVSGSVSNIWLTNKVGFGKAIVIGAFAQLVGYAIQAAAPPFPAFTIGYLFNGFGLSLQDAQANGYVASYRYNAAARMGVLHGVYGLGAFCSPLVATQFANMRRWSFHYLCSLGVALINLVLLSVIFRFKTQDECLAEVGQQPEAKDSSEDGHYRQIFKLRALHLLAFFTLIYVGVEVTVGSWSVTYVQDQRGGGLSSGYISSGFFGGLALGRVALLWLNSMVGERRVIFLYIILAIGLELVVWLVPSLVGGAVAVSIVGLLLGPVYPIIMNESSRILPRWLLTGCIGWIAGLGQAGSAVLPFMTGAIASGAGIQSLQPLLVSMMGLLMVLWALVPRPKAQHAD